MDKETIRGGKVREDLLHKIIALQILRMEWMVDWVNFASIRKLHSMTTAHHGVILVIYEYKNENITLKEKKVNITSLCVCVLFLYWIFSRFVW